jgi:hypothetical protein
MILPRSRGLVKNAEVITENIAPTAVENIEKVTTVRRIQEEQKCGIEERQDPSLPNSEILTPLCRKKVIRSAFAQTELFMVMKNANATVFKKNR